MQTLKTAIVVVLLLVVFYGVYEMLNRPPDEPPPGVAELPELTQPEIDFGNLDDGSRFRSGPLRASRIGHGTSGGVETRRTRGSTPCAIRDLCTARLLRSRAAPQHGSPTHIAAAARRSKTAHRRPPLLRRLR